jgi:hypothetical protein
LTDTTSFTVDNLHQIYDHPSFVRTRPSIIFHFGTGQTLVTPQVNDIVQSYFNRMTHNFVVVNYDEPGVIITDVR